jgi:type 1 glutamine amidotransferase
MESRTPRAAHWRRSWLLAATVTLLGNGCIGGTSTARHDVGSGGATGVGSAGASAADAATSGVSGSAGSTIDASAQNDATSMTGDAEAATTFDGGPGQGIGDAGPPPIDAARSNKVLIYAVTTAYRHASIPAAAAAIAQAAAAAGLTTEIVGASDATNIVDATKFTAAALAQYGAVILLANDGEPFGYPATQEIQNLTDYVQHGGALVAAECATDCYGGGFSGPMDGHPLTVPFHDLLGGTFSMHSAFAPATCTKTNLGDHPSVAQLAPTFNLTDEIYAFSTMRMDDQVVLTCISSTDPYTVRPISWFRQEGLGRVFYSALGHPAASWTMPMDPKVPMSRLVQDHVLPGLLWAMQR